MKRKPRLLVLVAIFVIVLASSAIYANYRMNNLLNQSGLLSPGQASAVSPTASSVDSPGQDNRSTNVSSGSQETKSGKVQPYSTQAGNNIVINNIQKKVSQPIAKKDLLTAGIIIVRKLDPDEISYLKNLALKGSCSPEEYKRSQEILTNKLSADDINTLKELGKKYGNNMSILNPDAKS